MAIKNIGGLISFTSNTQLVIDQLAAILVSELAAQQILAQDAGEDPDLYKARVFTQRFNPFDQFKNDETPLVHIELSDDATKFDVTAPHGKNQKQATFFIDCYGVGKAEPTATGHIAADKKAAQESQRIANLVRAILRADINANIQLDRKTVNSCMFSSEQYFVPDFDSRQAMPVTALRLQFQCNITDQIMINDGVPLESIIVDIEREDSGEVYAKLEYDYS